MNKRPEKNTDQEILLDLQIRCAAKTPAVEKLTVFTFLLLIFVLAILFFILPDKAFSEQENRALQQAPKISYSEKPLGRLLDGSYTADIAKYYADQFPARDLFIGVKGFTEIALGKKENNSVLLAKDGYLITRPSDPDYEALEENLASVADFADLMKRMDIPVTLAVIGRTYEAMSSYLPDSFPKDLTNRSWDYVQSVADGSQSLHYVNLLEPLKSMIDNGQAPRPIYYRTDHHWTTLGAYYAYAEIINSFVQKRRGFFIFRYIGICNGIVFNGVSVNPDVADRIKAAVICIQRLFGSVIEVSVNGSLAKVFHVTDNQYTAYTFF
jgi:hypothetical protein